MELSAAPDFVAPTQSIADPMVAYCLAKDDPPPAAPRSIRGARQGHVGQIPRFFLVNY
jgi:hypothetical protein